jgi:proprotein convertase subtilisin/kexin type 5
LYCPDGYITDILRQKCVALVSLTTEVVYTMAYSTGSCKNMCGKMVQDCSCAPSCKSRGNCCTDYEAVNCDGLVPKAEKVKDECTKNKGCDYCDDSLKHDDNIAKCNQCKDNFYLLDGRCYEICPEGTITDNINYLCNKKPACDVKNCDLCDKINKNQCSTCTRGFFRSNNQCLEKCPAGYRADRITWSCLEPPGKILILI